MATTSAAAGSVTRTRVVAGQRPALTAPGRPDGSATASAARPAQSCTRQPRCSRALVSGSAAPGAPRARPGRPAPRAVLELQVLEVDARLADVVEQPAQRARLVGHQHRHHRVRRRRGAVLAGDPGVAGVAAGHGAGEHAAGALPVAARGAAPASRARTACSTASRSARELLQHRAQRGGVAGQDLGPHHRVAGRDPRDVAQPLAGQGHRAVGQLAQPGGDQAGGDLRHVRDRGHRGVVVGRGHPDRGRADGHRQVAAPPRRPPRPPPDRVPPPSCAPRTGRPAPRSRPTAPVRPSGGTRRSAAGRPRGPQTCSSTASLTDATSVTTASGQAASSRTTTAATASGGAATTTRAGAWSPRPPARPPRGRGPARTRSSRGPRGHTSDAPRPVPCGSASPSSSPISPVPTTRTCTPAGRVTAPGPAAARRRRAGRRAVTSERVRGVLTCAISRITSGMAPAMSSSWVHISGTSPMPSSRAASAGNSLCTSGVAVNTIEMTSSLVEVVGLEHGA